MSGMELNGAVRNGDIKQQNLTTLEADRIKRPSLTPSSELQDDEEEEGKVTPLPGSILELDVLAWPPDEDGEVHVTVIPSSQVSVVNHKTEFEISTTQGEGRAIYHLTKRTKNAAVTLLPHEDKSDDARRKSRYSTYNRTPPRLIPRPDNHLCLAITAMLCCCLPLGFVGFICALQVDSAYDDGNREGAVWRAKNAKYWSLTAVVFGMLGIIGASFYLIFYHLVPAIS